MFRCWFPDAEADLSRIENHVRTIYKAGFGGMEIAMVPQYAEFDPREYGWATPRWKEMLRRILRTAADLPEPFKIDLTITAHWAPGPEYHRPQPSRCPEGAAIYGHEGYLRGKAGAAPAGNPHL